MPVRHDRPVWIHASSVGEVRLGLRLWRELATRDLPVFLTSTTATGLSLASAESGGALPTAACPLDLNPAVRRAFGRVQPRALVLVETELWPGFLTEARRLGIPVIVVNARLSDRTLKRFHLLKGLLEPLLDGVLIGAQDEENARRFRALGAQVKNIHITGNMKYDLGLPPNSNSLRDFLATRLPADRPPLWVAGSVREGEEPLVLEAHRTLRATLHEARLILAPRHLNRVPSTLQSAGALGLSCALRSQPPTEGWDVLILDSVGELMAAYAHGDACFVGGSLVPLGGQNLIEPAILRKPVLFGPSTENFRLEAMRLETSGGGIRVGSPACLAGELARLLRDPARLRSTGDKALAVVDAHRGASVRNAELVASRIGAPPR